MIGRKECRQKAVKADDSNYFSYDNMEQITGMDEHIAFAGQLLSRYHWGSQKRDELEKKLGKIREKQADKKLNMSVIGEFNSGKSSFINALLRSHIIEENVMPGMTAACTIITYGEKFSIKLVYKNGNKEKYVYGNEQTLCEKVKYYTTDDLVAPKLESVEVTLPSNRIKGNIRIIDTPGTNYTKAWHEEVTKKTIQEISDLSIIIISASKPLPETLCKFVHGQLSNIINQCVFVVTKVDEIRKKERGQILQYIYEKAKQEFSIQDPVVLPYVSPAIFNQYQPKEKHEIEYTQKDQLDFVEMCVKSEQELFAHTARQRKVAQSKKILQLIDVMYHSINEHLLQISNDYDQELAFPQRSKQTDLSKFIREQKTICTNRFMQETETVLVECKNQLAKSVSSAVHTVLKKIDDCSSIDQLKNYSDTSLQADCISQGKSIIKEARSFHSKLREHLTEQMEYFCNKFEKEFANLKILSVKIGAVSVKDPEIQEIHEEDMREAARIIAENLKKENNAFFGGAAAGAAVGSMIAPGLGTILGAVIGFVGGAAVSPDVSDVKNKVKPNLNAALQSYYRKVEQDSEDALQDYRIRLSENMESEIDRYLSSYKQMVDQRIYEQKKKENEIASRKSQLRSDMEQIRTRQYVLESVQKNLNQFGSIRD